MRFPTRFSLVPFLSIAIVFSSAAWGQLRTRLPPGGATTTGESGTGLTPIPPSSYGPGATLGQPTFDPYSTAPPSGGLGGVFGGSAPPQPPAIYGGTGVYGNPPAYGGVPGAAPGVPGSYPTAPPALFPNGVLGPDGFLGPEGQIVGTPLRFLQGPRFRHGWLEGGDGREVDINETDVSVVVTYPNFFFSTQPIYIAPSFSLTLWDNPEGPTFPAAADLPAQTYAAYLDSLWKSDPNRVFGADLGVRVGIWSDFDTLTTDSFRIQGMGMFRVKLTPALAMRAGVLYVDRAHIKLLPAGGLLWEPNAQTRFDIFFPQPKLAQYLTTLGNQDVWWYVGGEFGGNSWTIERAVDGLTDRFDYNDIRVILGIEWGRSDLFREGRRLGFAEIAWVTEREVRYVRRPQDDFTIRDTFMLRAGIGY